MSGNKKPKAGSTEGIEVTNRIIREAYAALQAMGNIKWPVTTSLLLAKLRRKLQALVEPIEEARSALLKKYGETDDDGKVVRGPNGQIKVADEHAEACEGEYKTLMDITETVQSAKIKLPTMVTGTCDKCNHNMERPLEIETNLLAGLIDFLEE